jgi:hypothetical protein
MAQKVLFQEGIKRLEELNLQKYRHEFFLKEIKDIENKQEDINNLVEKAIKLLPDTLQLEKLEKKIYMKESKIGFSMKWHCDDCCIFKHKDNFKYSNNNLKINDRYSLYFTKLPVYSMVIYLSTQDNEFTGGEFNFVDKKIKPEKYKVIFFDSREIHKVEKVKTGTRTNILVKFYLLI